MSYVPLIAPSTSLNRIKFLTSIADSFIYVVSRMGTTGSSVKGKINSELPDIIARVREHTTIPIAVGFGVATRAHFEYVQNAGADGVVIGSRLVNIIKEASLDTVPHAVESFCRKISQNGFSPPAPIMPTPPASVTSNLEKITSQVATTSLPARFGQFGGQYVPEALFDCLLELEEAHKSAMSDPEFWKEFEGYYGYMNRPSKLYFAESLTKHAGGAQIWLKREDLNHTGSHKINNAIGQILLAKRLGKKRIIAETGAGQHGVATATVCARFGLECVVYMGAEDVRRQALNVFRMKMLGATVIPVESGSRTLKDAVNDALRDWVTNLATTHYLVGSCIGPHPFPTIVRDFQKVIGKEVKSQLQEIKSKLPDVIVACVGGGSNAIGTFYDFIPDENVQLVGVEAGGEGLCSDTWSNHAFMPNEQVSMEISTVQRFPKARLACFMACGRTFYNPDVVRAWITPELDQKHAWLKDSGRAEYLVATDEDALRGFRLITQLEGIIPALESSHAIWEGVRRAKMLSKETDLVICLSGRGDKDVEQISQLLPGKWADKLDWHI
ncbi:tryptophan synthase beta subunit-like PLP-dependent enzyme [Chiua virens]|nr:tryptophan synthase beta subunit-like PLP-dependent enzyme [Chiua virens]